jgi:hypothetical protein
MIRAIVSVGPPAENGTTIATGRAGKFCADAAVQPKTTATAKSRNPFMAPFLRTMVTLRPATLNFRNKRTDNTTKNALPAALTPASAAPPSWATKYRSTI